MSMASSDPIAETVAAAAVASSGQSFVTCHCDDLVSKASISVASGTVASVHLCKDRRPIIRLCR